MYPEATYEIKLSLKDTEARTLKAYVPVNNYTLFTSEDSLHHSEKSVTLSIKGAELIAYANNTYKQFTIRMNLGWVANGSSHHGMVEIVNLSVKEVLQNVIPANHNYSYGFNGMERDDEVSGSGNSYTTFYRQNDVRLGKWLSRDPLSFEFPWQSPYSSMDNNPILYNDPFGDSVKTNQEGFSVINEGMTRSLAGGGSSPFGYNSKNSQVTFNQNFDRTQFSPEQLQLIDEFAIVVTDKQTTEFSVVDFDELLVNAGGLTGKSLSSRNLNGFTTNDGKRTFVARNPQKPGMVQNPKFNGLNGAEQPPEVPGMVDTYLFYRSLNAIHEIVGHAGLAFTKPWLSKTQKWNIVEQMETRVRQHFKIGIHTKKTARKARKKTGKNIQKGDIRYLEGEASKHSIFQ